MAAVYSLVCFGGKTGKTVTISIASPAVATLTNHGLWDGTGVVLSTTGALPTGLTAGVTYYARSTASDTFNLYDTSAHAIAGGSTGRVTTSGSQSGVHTVKGAYFSGLSDLSRYGSPGSERVYDGLASWRSARSSATGVYDNEICEIGEAFQDRVTSMVSLDLNCDSTSIYPINDCGHNGVYNSGYVLCSATPTYEYVLGLGVKATVDGITIRTETQVIGGVEVQGLKNTLKNCFIINVGGWYSNRGIRNNSVASNIYNNIVVGMNDWGYWGQGYAGTACVVANNTVIACTNGIGAGVGQQHRGAYYNNVAVGCTVNYSDLPSEITAQKNAGGADAQGVPWHTGADSTVRNVPADNTTFVDYTNKVLRPCAGSLLVDSGREVTDIPAEDITGSERPNYNNGGAETWDIGAFEYDHGYVRPASTTVTFSGVNAGSEIRVYNSTGVELDGTESCAADQTLSWTIPADPIVTVRIVSMAYKIKEFSFTSTVGAVSLPVQQEPDPWYSNPA